MSYINMSLSMLMHMELQAMYHTCGVTLEEGHIPVIGGDFRKLYLFQVVTGNDSEDLRKHPRSKISLFFNLTIIMDKFFPSL